MNPYKILVADVGGSHITVGSFEKNQNEYGISSFMRKEVDSKASKESILNAWADIFRHFMDNPENVKIGIAFPAPFDYEKGICLIEEQGKFESLFQVNIKKALARKLNIRSSQIKFINDAKAFLVGESIFGLGKGYDNVLGLTLGSGLGSALKMEEKIFDAGLWSSPFKEGIAEDYLATSWFVLHVAKKLGKKVSGVKELVQSSEFDEERDFIFDLYSRNLANFIEILVLQNPIELVIIGGNIALSHHLFLDRTKEYLHSSGIDIEIKISELGEKSALMGAAALFLHQKKLSGQRLV